MKRIVIFLLMCLGMAAATGAEDAYLPVIKGAEITLDGAADEPAWARAAPVNRFSRLRANGAAAAEPSSALMFTDGRTLYVAVKCWSAAPDRLRTESTTRDLNVWTDDCVELFVSPEATGEHYWQFIVTAANVRGDAKCDSGSKDLNWNGEWESAARITPEGFEVEFAIPLALFGRTGNDTWRIAIARENMVTGELSCWPDLGTGFHNPAAFAILHGVIADADLFNYTLSGIEFADPEEAAAGVAGTLRATVDAVCAGSEPVRLFVTNRNDFTLVSELAAELAQGTNTLDFRLKLPEAGSYLGTLSVAGEYPTEFEFTADSSPLLVDLYDPRYRNYIFDSMKLDRVTAEVRLRDPAFAGKPLRAVFLDAAGNTLGETETKVPTESGLIEVPVPAELAVGDYQLVVTAGQFRKVLPLEKVVPRTGNSEVYFDACNNLVYNGKTVFPLGFYYYPPLGNIAEYGFNTIVCTGQNLELSAAGEQLRQQGIMSVAKNSFLHEDWLRGNDPLPEDLLARTAARNDYAGSELIGWYTSDEPDYQTADAARFRSMIDAQRATGGLIPQVICFNNSRGLIRSTEHLDVFQLDIYVGFSRDSDGPIVSCEMISGAIDDAVRISRNRRPVWFVQECFPGGYYGGYPEKARFPTIGETRLMSYLAIIHGVKGITMWDHSVLLARRLWPALKEYGREIQALAPWIMAGPCDNPPRRVGNIHFLEKELDGRIVLFAVNPYPAGVEVRLPASRDGSYKVLGQGRNVMAAGGEIADAFEPFGTNIYVNFDMDDAAMTKILKEYQRSDSFIGQETPGNLADYWNGARVTSTNRNPYTFDASVIDGACGVYNWHGHPSPGTVTITLPRVATVRRVRMVTASEGIRLVLGGQEPKVVSSRKCFIVWDDANDRWAEVDDPAGYDIASPAVDYFIEPVETDTVFLDNVGHIGEVQVFE